MPNKDDKYLVVRRDGTVPKWPNWVLGARDPAAPAGLRAYANECEKLGMAPDYVKLVRKAAKQFEQYLREEGPGDPDMPYMEMRTDDWGVREALSGEPATISVHTDQFNAAKGFDANVTRRL